jgi:hypothetical protein
MIPSGDVAGYGLGVSGRRAVSDSQEGWDRVKTDRRDNLALARLTPPRR